jgi:hypothetical protein
METKTNQLMVFKMDVKTYPNEYSEKFEHGMFKESIKVNPLTCVFRKWESTRYSLDSMPTASIYE